MCRVFSIVNGDIWTLKLKAKVPCSKQERKDVCVNINTDDGDINYSNAVSYGVTCAKRKRRMITDGLALGDISPSRSLLSLTEAIHLEMSRSYEQFQGLARGVMGSVHSFGTFPGDGFLNWSLNGSQLISIIIFTRPKRLGSSGGNQSGGRKFLAKNCLRRKERLTLGMSPADP